MTYQLGGRSIRNTETVDEKWFPLTNTLGTHVTREATLDLTLSRIEDRRLQSVVITKHGEPVLTLDYESAKWLYLALMSAVDRVEDMQPDYVEPHEVDTCERCLAAADPEGEGS